MKTKPGIFVKHHFAYLALLFCVAFVSGCASVNNIQAHTFSFDTFADSPEIEVLDYRYGSNGMTRASEWQKKNLGTIQGGSVTGNYARGGNLFVRWRIRATGEEHEDTVDLTNRLPKNIENHTVTFIIKDTQLYVYLVSRKNRDPANPPNGPQRFQYRKVVTIYPDQEKS